jgi:hypothetical protein
MHWHAYITPHALVYGCCWYDDMILASMSTQVFFMSAAAATVSHPPAAWWQRTAVHPFFGRAGTLQGGRHR